MHGANLIRRIKNSLSFTHSKFRSYTRVQVTLKIHTLKVEEECKLKKRKEREREKKKESKRRTNFSTPLKVDCERGPRNLTTDDDGESLPSTV